MFDENTLTRIIQDTRYAGEHPLLQFDLLDAATLLRIIQAISGFSDLDAWRLAKVLKQLEMRALGLHSVEGNYCHLWTSLPPQPIAAIVNEARRRMRAWETDLKTELVENPPLLPLPPRRERLTQFDREVLTLRLRAQGVRYPRPREIATRLNCAQHLVYISLQRIRRALDIQSLKDAAQFRKAVLQSGALMDDPAFS